MDVSSIALQGLQQAESQVEKAASNLVSAATGSGGDTVDLSSQILALNSAQTAFQTNLVALETADQLQSTIDLMA